MRDLTTAKAKTATDEIFNSSLDEANSEPLNTTSNKTIKELWGKAFVSRGTFCLYYARLFISLFTKQNKLLSCRLRKQRMNELIDESINITLI